VNMVDSEDVIPYERLRESGQENINHIHAACTPECQAAICKVSLSST